MGGAVAVTSLVGQANVAAARTDALVARSQPIVSQIDTRRVERRIIGRSVKGRPIVADLYGDEDAEHVGVFIGSMHGTERAGVLVVNHMRQLLPPVGSAMWIIRTINPDGHVMRTRKNARGVDLNRNTTYLWKGKSRDDRYYYPGRSPASEPETRAYMGFLSSVKPNVVLIFHQAENGVDIDANKNPRLVRKLARQMRLPVLRLDCDGECTGTLTGWFNNSQRGTAITIELPARTNQTQIRRWARASMWSMGQAAFGRA